MTDVEPEAPKSPADVQRETVKNEDWQVYIRKWLGAVATFVGVVAVSFAAFQFYLSRDTAQRQLRAYVGATIGPISNIAEMQKPRVAAMFKNYGQTPATVQFWISSGFVEDVSVDLPAEPLRTERFVLFPGNDFSVALDGPVLDATDIDGMNSGRRPLAIFGQLRYIDAFQKPRQTKFRVLYGGRNGVNALYWGPTGNSFD
jgi:hypothetical protein